MLKILKPSRNEGLVFVGLLIAVTGMFLPISYLIATEYFGISLFGGIHDDYRWIVWCFFASLVGGLAGLGLIVGDFTRFSLMTRTVAFVVALVGAISFEWSVRIHELINSDTIMPLEAHWNSWLSPYRLWIVAGVFVVAAFLSLLVQALITLIRKQLSFRVERKHLLVTTAVLFLAVFAFRNIVFWNELDFFDDASSVGSFGALMISIAVLMGCCVFRLHSFWQRAFLGLVGFGALCWAWSISTEFAESRWAEIGYVSCSAFGLVVVSAFPKSNENSGKAKERPNLIYAVPVLLTLVSVGLFIKHFDMATLCVLKTERWKYSRLVGELRSDSDYKIELTISEEMVDGGLQGIAVELSENASPDCLTRLGELPGVFSVTIRNLNPQSTFDPDFLKRLTYISLEDSKVSVQQLNQLGEFCNEQIFVRNVNVSEQFGQADLSTGPGFTICEGEPGEARNFLAAIEDFSSNSKIRTYDIRIDESDWEQLVRASQSCPVTVDAQVVDSDLLNWRNEKGLALDNLRIRFTSEDNLEFGFWLALYTDATVSFPSEWAERQDDKYWESYYFTRGNPELAAKKFDSYKIGLRNGELQFRDLAEKNQWVVAQTNSGEVESFFFPGFHSAIGWHLAEFTKLKRLYLTSQFVGEPYSLFPDNENLDFVKRLPVLEELYLPIGFSVDEDMWQALSNCPSLRTIGFNGSFYDLFDDVQLNSVETLFIYRSMFQYDLLTCFPNLKKVVIHDERDYLSYKGSMRKHEEANPGVEFVVVPKSDWSKMIPDEVFAHKERITNQVRQRMFGD